MTTRRNLRLVKTDFGPSLEILRGYNWVYVASPYTSFEGDVDTAAIEINLVLLKLRAQRLYNLFSPIAHWHEAAYLGDLPTSHEAWRDENRHKLEQCSVLLIVELPGWDLSDGIKWEISVMKKASKPIYFLNPQTLELR